MLDLIPGAKISASGMDAEKRRMEIIANNLANVNTSAGSDEVYQKRIPVFRASFKDEFGKALGEELNGVKLEAIVKSNSNPIRSYAPYHPDADAQGMVNMPNISPMEEMIDMISATRAYEANINVLTESRKLADKAVNMFK